MTKIRRRFTAEQNAAIDQLLADLLLPVET
jgi:hypothetical protein